MIKSKYACDELIETLRDMKLHEIIGEGYACDYTRADITDALHDAFGFRTDYEFMDKADIKKIITTSKKIIVRKIKTINTSPLILVTARIWGTLYSL